MAWSKWKHLTDAEGWEWSAREDEERPEGWEIRCRAEQGLAVVQATWKRTPSFEIGPDEVTITRKPAMDPHGRPLLGGVTTTVTRQAGELLVRMSSVVLPRALEALGYSRVEPDPVRSEIERRAQALPVSPREDDSYYEQLFGLYDLIVSTGVRDPLKQLVRLTGKPEGTVRLHIRRGREESSPE